ncbi:MAG: PadR family transcriptional regulator [Vicinamibacterales bacterium]
MGKATDVVQGTLDVLILKVINAEPLHGWAIAQRIKLLSDDVLQVQQGSLYPALQRLERQGWVAADWGASENNRRARYYRPTKSGRRHLEQEEAAWNRMSAAVSLVLQRAQS